jgi:hypothetical protein
VSTDDAVAKSYLDRALDAEERVAALEEALRQIADERPITEDIYDMALAALEVAGVPVAEEKHE